MLLLLRKQRQRTLQYTEAPGPKPWPLTQDLSLVPTVVPALGEHQLRGPGGAWRCCPGGGLPGPCWVFPPTRSPSSYLGPLLPPSLRLQLLERPRLSGCRGLSLCSEAKGPKARFPCLVNHKSPTRRVFAPVVGVLCMTRRGSKHTAQKHACACTRRSAQFLHAGQWRCGNGALPA